MIRSEEKKLYRMAVSKWGLPSQMGMLMEECAELIQATHKVMRNGAKDLTVWDKLIEEMADVEIMIDQIKAVISWHNLGGKVADKKEKKLLRLKQLLNNK